MTDPKKGRPRQCARGHAAIKADRTLWRAGTVPLGFQDAGGGQLLEHARCKVCGSDLYIEPERLDKYQPTVWQVWTRYAQSDLEAARRLLPQMLPVLAYLGARQTAMIQETDLETYRTVRLIRDGMDPTLITLEAQALKSVLAWFADPPPPTFAPTLEEDQGGPPSADGLAGPPGPATPAPAPLRPFFVGVTCCHTLAGPVIYAVDADGVIWEKWPGARFDEVRFP